METYSVTVNGITYEVQVEKKSSVAAQSQMTTHAQAPVADPSQVRASAAKASPVAATELIGEKITAGAAGKVWKIVAAEGEAVKAGDTVVILEAMKMEIPVVSSRDGVIGRIIVAEGSPVEAGDVLATIR
jgi:biotin carboxyl carrier protein